MPHALAVDDDPNFLNALAELIEGQGFTTNTATTLRDARERLLHKSPDIALIDLRLPDGSGMELLRELEKTNTTEVIVITGHADVDSAVEALRVGATDYLTKPLDVARLKEILAAVARDDLSLPDAQSPMRRGEGAEAPRPAARRLAADVRPLRADDPRRAHRRDACSSSARAAPARSSSPQTLHMLVAAQATSPSCRSTAAPSRRR